MHQTLRRAYEQRKELGDLFLLLHLLHPWLSERILSSDAMPVFFTYAGFDVMKRWATYLLDERRTESMHERLSEALGVTATEIELAQQFVDEGAWQYRHVGAAVDRILLGEACEAQTINPCGTDCLTLTRGLEQVLAQVGRDRVPRCGWPEKWTSMMMQARTGSVSILMVSKT